MANDLGISLLAARDFDSQLAEQTPTHFYYSNGVQQGLVEHPQRFAIALNKQVASETGIESLGLTFVRKLNSDFSVYDLAFQNGVPQNATWHDSPLIRDAASVFVSTQSHSEAVVLDELIVGLANGIEPESYFACNSHFSSYRPLAGTSDQYVATVVGGTGEVTLAVANQLQNDNRLAWVEPNFYQDWQKYFTPNDARFSNQWHLNNTGQSGGTVDADSDLPEAWDVIQGGSVDYTIGIIDDGVVTNHPDLTVWVNPGEVAGDGLDNDGNGWVDDVNGWNFVSNSNASSNTSADDMHGTSVSGVAAAKGNNGIGVAGASYGSKVLSAKIFEGTAVASDANIASALYYAAGRKANGSGTWKAADVLNNSWGGGASATVINNALTWGTTLGRQGKGAPIFVASGNEFGAVSEPALQSLNIPGVFAVGAINNKAEKSDYSNFGPAVDLVTSSNDTRAGYLAIDTTDRPGTAGYDPSDYTGTGTNGFGGTSSATPLASGIAALVLARADQVAVTLTPAQLRSYLRANTDIVGSSAYSITTGRNDNMGWGRLNAASGVSNLGKAEISVLSTNSELFNGGTGVNFGSVQVGNTFDVTLRVRNQGTTSLNLSSLTIGSGPFLVQSGFGSSTLALGAATTFTIRFLPTAEGIANGTVTIGSNDTDEALFNINLTGTGTASGTGSGNALLAWDVNGQTAFGTQGLTTSKVATGLTNTLGLTRGSGVTTINTSVNNAWGGNGWASTATAGVTGNQFVSFGFTVGAGKTASLSAIDLNYRRSNTGSVNGFWQYQINTGSWTDISDIANEFSSSTTTGTAMTQLSLTGISGLQGLAAGTTANFRVVPYGATSTGGTWYIYDMTGDDLVLSGSVQAAGGTNSAPTDIALSPTSIAENAGANATIGALSSTDPNSGNTFTYTLVTGTGNTDNAAFAITGNTLKANASFDFETKSSYSVRIRTTDQGGLFFEKALTINVTNVNEAPTDIVLSSNSVAINAAGGTTIGTLATSDPDAANTFTYTLSGTDAGKFAIVSNSLKVGSTALDGVQASYSLSITSTDQGGLSVTKSYTIGTTGANNSAPTDISLSSASIAENAGTNAPVGTFSSTDPDAGNTFTYSLVAGTGSTDNSAFTVTGSGLSANASFDFETKNSYLIRVRTTDQGGLFFEKAFTINVTNVNDAPTVTTTSGASAYAGAGAVVVDPSISIADVDSANLSGATIAITNGLLGSEDSFGFVNANGIAGSYNASTGVLTLTGAASLANYQTALRSVTYNNSNANPNTATRTVSFQVNDGSLANNLSNAATKLVTVAAANSAPLAIQTFAQNASGVDVAFNRPVNVASINLYDQGTTLGVPDVSLVGTNTGPVRGSLVFNSDNTGFTFIKTGSMTTGTGTVPGTLTPDTYTLTLRSNGTDGFGDSAGNALRDVSGSAAGDYIRSFNVAAPAANAITVSIPDFARGYSQSVNVPNTSAGLPVVLSTANNVSVVDFSITYDPTLLSITGFSATNASASLAFNVSVPGVASVSIVSDAPLAASDGAYVLGTFTASVLPTAPYGSKEVIRFKNIDINDSSPAALTIPSIADNAVHVAAFFGDTSGNQVYGGNDALLVQRVVVGTSSGFTAFQLADPYIVGDISLNLGLGGNDALFIQRAVVGTAVPNIPALPVGVTPPPAGGPDPKIFVPKDLVAIDVDPLTTGVQVDMPVKLLVTEAVGITLLGVDFQLDYDPAKLTIESSGVTTGDLLSGSNLISGGFTGRVSVANGRISLSQFSNDGTQLLPFGTTGDLFKIRATIVAGATGEIALNLRGTGTALYNNNVEELTLVPAPTDGANDEVDGLLSIPTNASGPPKSLLAYRGSSSPQLAAPLSSKDSESTGVQVGWPNRAQRSTNELSKVDDFFQTIGEEGNSMELGSLFSVELPRGSRPMNATTKRDMKRPSLQSRDDSNLLDDHHFAKRIPQIYPEN